MKQVYGVFFGDGIAKAILAATTILLIAVMDVNNYAYFTLIFTAIMMGYQTVSGVVERLYIVEHYAFSGVAAKAIFIIGIALSVVFFAYVVNSAGFLAGFLFLIGIGTFIYYQFQRIKLQKQERFFYFVLMDIVKNTVWLLFVLFIILTKPIHSVELIIVAMILSVVPPLVSLYKVLNLSNMSDNCTRSSSCDFNDAWIYIKSRKTIVIYSILAGLMPYFPVILADLTGDNQLIATYGAALRYQAILAMAVYAANVVFLPKISNCNTAETADIVKKFYSSLPVAMVLLVMFCAISVLAMPYLDGGKYEHLQLSFLILAVCSLLTLISTPMVNILISNKQYSTMLAALLLGVASNLIAWPIGIVLSESYGILLATLFGYIVVNGLFLYFGNKLVLR